MAIYSILADTIYSILADTISSTQTSPWKYSLNLDLIPSVQIDELMTVGSVDGGAIITHFIGTGFNGSAGTITSMKLIDTANGNVVLEEITDINIAHSYLVDLINQTAYLQTELGNMVAAFGGQSYLDIRLPDPPIFVTSELLIRELTDGTITRYHGTDFAVDSYGNPTSGTIISADHFDLGGLVINSYTYTDPIVLSPNMMNPGFQLWDSIFSGTDTINGSMGNDMIDGGAGSDTLTGGAEFDVFTFGRDGWGDDTITDFTIGEDIISLVYIADITDINDLTITDDGSGNAIITNGINSITLTSVSASSLSANGFYFSSSQEQGVVQ